MVYAVLWVTQERLCSIFGAMFEPSYVQRTCFEVLDFLRRLFEMFDPDRIRWQNSEREIMLYLSPWYRPGGTRISMASTLWDKDFHGIDLVGQGSPWHRPGGTRISMVSTRWDKDLHGTDPVGQGSPWSSDYKTLVRLQQCVPTIASCSDHKSTVRVNTSVMQRFDFSTLLRVQHHVSTTVPCTDH